ncbi:hypothetical protein HPHPH36_1157 [Helicobacter pylori Hp H-36]|nr:hypothetical protein HPHPH36_1157 [Helicobacter pylori Hp H-36]
MFLKSVGILNFFISLRYGCFWLCDTKLFKMGFFALFCHFKTHFKVLL